MADDPASRSAARHATADHDRRHRQRAGRGRRSVPAPADRRVDRQAGPALEAGFLVGRGLQRLGRAQPQAAGAYPGGAGCSGPARVAFSSSRSPARQSRSGRGNGFKAFSVTWPAFGDVSGEGLLLEPNGKTLPRRSSSYPTRTKTPEQLAGLSPILPDESQVARRLAESGCRVIVPSLIDRKVEARNGRAKLTSREFLYRPAFELGRHLIGYEVQKVLALVDRESTKSPVSIFGYGEGGSDRPVRRLAGHPYQGRLRQRLLRQSQHRLDPADRPQCLRPARPVRRCRASESAWCPGR